MTGEDQRPSRMAKSVDPDVPRPPKLYRWGVFVAHKRRAVLIVSVLVLACSAALLPVLQRALGAPGYQVKGSESARVEQLLERRFPNLGTETDALVLDSRSYIASDGVYRRAITSVVSTMRRQKGVLNVLGPYDTNAVGQISAGEHAAIVAVTLSGNSKQRFDSVLSLQSAATRAVGDSGVSAWLTGYTPLAKDTSEVENTDTGRAESIGLPVALLVLLLAMGAPIAALMPIVMASLGLVMTFGVLAVLALLFRFDNLLLALVTMMGLAIGIDYALFVISRFREELGRADQGDRGESERVAHAIGVALATSGRTILFSGVIVALSLSSMFVVNSPLFQEIAVGASVVVLCMLLAALTLLPAMLSLLGLRINMGALPGRMQPADIRPDAGEGRRGGWARWALLMMRHPIFAAGAATAVLVVAAIPVLSLHYGINLGVLSVSTTNSGKGEKVLAKSFSPGAVAPIQIIVSGGAGGKGSGSNVAGAEALYNDLEHDSRVTAVIEKRSKFGVLLTAIASVPIDSLAATSLVQHIRKDLAPRIHVRGGPSVLVGGSTAEAVDISNEMRTKFPLVIVLVLGLSFLFLMLVFRSIVLPIKAVFMNLLVTGAALGLVVFVFQSGHGEHLLNFTSAGFIQAYLPLLAFALLFGLSMDYEVFLIRRMQEEWKKTHDNELAVVTGLEHTARPISAAAAIMVAIFGCFVTADILELKQVGFALAVAVALDASLVRLVLVPATMRLFGAWNWWLPTRLARVLPDLGVD
jgi:RND superfamily putative drug exporter